MIRPNIIFLFFLVFLFACKKDKVEQVNSGLDGSPVRAHFEDTLLVSPNSNGDFFATIAGNNTEECFYVTQKISGSSYLLVKTNLNADVTYTRQIELSPDHLLDFCGSKSSEDFFTLTAPESNGVWSGQTIQAYIYVGGASDSNSCGNETNLNNYSFNSEFNPLTVSQFNSVSQLKKFNSRGEEVWNRTLEGNFFTGNSLETDPQGNIYVLTTIKYPKAAKLMPFGNLIPYYSFTLDSNSVILHKFDVNGVLLFKTRLDHVFEGLPFDFNPSLALSSNAVYVKSLCNLLRFDLNGNLISTVKPIKNVCYNFMGSVLAQPDHPNAIVTGYLQYVYQVSSSRYFLNVNGSSESNVFTNAASIPFKLVVMDHLQNSYCGGSYVVKTSPTGQQLYAKSVSGSNYKIYLDERNCGIDQKNNLYCFSLESNLIKMYKLDKNGNLK